LSCRGPLYIHLSSLNCLAQPELVNVDVFELNLELLSCLSNNPDRLLVITVDDWSDASVEVKLLKEIVLLYKL
jgi:hypothetical protein